MKLSSLAISGVRNIIDARVADLGDINVFTGLNGAGKTSVLEAVYILGLAKSFRGAQLQPVIHYLSNTCTVFGELESLDDVAQRVAIGVKRAKKGGHKIMSKGDVINFMQTYQRITQNMFKNMPKYASIILNLNSNHQIKSAVYKSK